jgi:hypothetical protein
MSQGFYVSTRRGVVQAFAVPIEHTTQILGAYPDGRPRLGDAMAVLNRDFCYVDARGIEHWALDGMPTDGISIPRLLWRCCGHPFGRYFMAAVIHDDGCYYANSLPPGNERDAARAMIDDLFGEMCLWLDPSAPRVAAMWRQAVKMGGRMSSRGAPQPYYATDLAEVYDSMKLRHMLWPVLERMDVSPEGQALRERRMLAGRAAPRLAA